MSDLLLNGNVRSSIRDLMAAVFRRPLLLGMCVIATVAGALAGAFVHPKYESTTKILLQRERLDPVITTQASAVPMELANTSVSEEELNSEIELLTSGDVLRQAVLENHLESDERSWIPGFNQPDKLRARAVARLKKKLVAEVVSKANIITASYPNSNPEVARAVLVSVSNAYFQKHMALHRPAGKIEFFDEEAERSRKSLADIEARLVQFTSDPGGASPDVQKQFAVQKAAELSSSLEETRTAMKETEERIATLQQLQAVLPPRVSTQLRKSDNPQLLEQLKSSLLTLQLKRTELLTKYDPGYRLIKDLDVQIEQTRAVLDSESNKPLSDETTDRNPIREWVDSELTKAESDLPVLKVRLAATRQSMEYFQQEARELYNRELQFQDLSRTAKAEEDNYLLYMHKREEARITGVLDERRILNLSLVQEPDLPALPVHASWMYSVMGCVLGVMLAAGLLFIAEHMDGTFRTPGEVRELLGVGVVAALPAAPKGVASSGKAFALQSWIAEGVFKHRREKGRNSIELPNQ